MKLKGKLNVIVKIAYTEHMDKCGDREELTELFYKKSSHGPNNTWGDLSDWGAGAPEKVQGWILCLASQCGLGCFIWKT